MDATDDLAKQRAAIDHVVKNKLTHEEAEKYLKERGVVVRFISYQEEATPEEFEAGQRFVHRPTSGEDNS